MVFEKPRNLADFTSVKPPFKTVFSGLYCHGADQTNLIMVQNSEELRASIDFKRIQKKSLQADIKILKSKIKETKKSKTSDSIKVGIGRDYSDFSRVIKSISKMPKPSARIRFLLLNEGSDVLSEASASSDLRPKAEPTKISSRGNHIVKNPKGSIKKTKQIVKASLKNQAGANYDQTSAV